jgi:hypothetical protein
MDSTELSQEQAGELHAALFKHLNFLLRLKNRLEELRFPADDPLRVAATDAYTACWKLSQEAHRLSVRMGSGR